MIFDHIDMFRYFARTDVACMPHDEQIDKVYGREAVTALVGAPGQAKVYVFEYNAITTTWNQTQVICCLGSAKRLRNHD